MVGKFSVIDTTAFISALISRLPIPLFNSCCGGAKTRSRPSRLYTRYLPACRATRYPNCCVRTFSALVECKRA